MHAISVSLTTSVVFLLWRWQGGWEDDEDVYQAASRETMEEAGVKGVIHVRHQCLPFHSFTHGLSSCCLPINPHTLFSPPSYAVRALDLETMMLT